MSLKRFTNMNHLRGLGRPLFKEFFARFNQDPNAPAVALPDEALDEAAFFQALADLFVAPELLPPGMVEVLEAVVEMANDRGVERLTAAAKAKGLPIDWSLPHTHLDIALQVWLADGPLMLEVHSEQHVAGMASFHYFGTKTPLKERVAFEPPTNGTVELIRQAVDAWCRENHRGKDTVAVTQHRMDGEWVFGIQHGGTMAWASALRECPKPATLFYRPGIDDAVVYNVERDDLRIHARTRGELALYQREFGWRLRGDPDYFSERKSFTLDPLRADLALALSTDGLPDVLGITLQQVDILYGGHYEDRLILKSKDLVKSAAERARQGLDPAVIPAGGLLVSATFEFLFKGVKKGRKVKISIPDGVIVGRGGDRRAVELWLLLRNFRAVANGALAL